VGRLNQNRIARALSSIQRKQLRALLMGGQACVFYGAAEFSRDIDLALGLAPDDLRLFQETLDELQAECIAVPRFDAALLQAGHAVHFRCHAPGAEGLRIDVMHSMRGVEPFETLWNRRTTLETDLETNGPLTINLMSLPDLVQAKKTQRDKDWPMIRRLIEADYHFRHAEASDAQRRFWLLEARTPELLLELAKSHPQLCASLTAQRPLLNAALSGDLAEVESQLEWEERRERMLDREYWQPLKKELERLRHARQ
jgi:hypothetical protein